MKQNPLPTQTLTAFVLCSVVLLAFILLMLVPCFQAAAQLEIETDALRVRIEEQKVLNPIFQQLLKLVRKPGEPGFELPQEGRLKRTDTDMLDDQLAQLAAQNSLKLERYQPDASALMAESDRMHVDVKLTGDFFNLRPFLDAVCRLPYLEKMERLQIRTVEEGREFDIRLLLAIE